MDTIEERYYGLLDDEHEAQEALTLLQLQLYAERTDILRQALTYDPESAVPSIPEALVLLVDAVDKLTDL